MSVLAWVHPRVAARRLAEALGASREVAIEALVRRILAGKVVTIVGEYQGPKDEGYSFFPEYKNMPLWRGAWLSDVFRSPQSSVWTVGDVEGSLSGKACYFFNVRFHPDDFDATMAELGALSVNDNEQIELPTVRPALKLVAVARPIEPKWNWEAALAALVELANRPDGLSAIAGFDPPKRGSQARLEEWFGEHFSHLHDGEAPSEIERRKRAQLVMQALKKV